mmetsp:Transcript_55568/g.84105  ORF Transcript_55568/g.84105 Transcript_55568/m.84105 type:complete len:339 (+) Transcript_55568:760-1776(+)
MSPTMLLPISRTVIRGQRALSDFTTAGELASPIPFAETRSCLRVVGYARIAFARTSPPRAAIQFPLRSRCASCLHCRRQTVSQGVNWPISSRLQLMSRNVNAVHVPTNALAPVPVMSLACSLRLRRLDRLSTSCRLAIPAAPSSHELRSSFARAEKRDVSTSASSRAPSARIGFECKSSCSNFVHPRKASARFCQASTPSIAFELRLNRLSSVHLPSPPASCIIPSAPRHVWLRSTCVSAGQFRIAAERTPAPKSRSGFMLRSRWCRSGECSSRYPIASRANSGKKWFPARSRYTSLAPNPSSTAERRARRSVAKDLGNPRQTRLDSQLTNAASLLEM